MKSFQTSQRKEWENTMILANHNHCCYSAARNADGLPWRASTWWKRPAWAMVAPVAEVASATRRVAATRAAEAAEYHPDFLSRWDIGKLDKSTPSISSPLASRIGPSGYARYALVSSPLPSYFSCAHTALIYSIPVGASRECRFSCMNLYSYGDVYYLSGATTVVVLPFMFLHKQTEIAYITYIYVT